MALYSEFYVVRLLVYSVEARVGMEHLRDVDVPIGLLVVLEECDDDPR